MILPLELLGLPTFVAEATTSREARVTPSKVLVLGRRPSLRRRIEVRLS
jgi:hypothetical protein